jgi:CarD family transcriptional regulator
MEDQAQEYAVGDWIVHNKHGIGQIKGTMVNTISGEETAYLQVETSDSTLWLPVSRLDECILRPICTPEEIKAALAVLRRPPRRMDSDFRIRKNRISDVKHQAEVTEIARLIRDLRARQRKRSLNNTEQDALRSLTIRLIREWTACSDINEENAKVKLEALLQLGSEPEVLPLIQARL